VFHSNDKIKKIGSEFIARDEEITIRKQVFIKSKWEKWPKINLQELQYFGKYLGY